VVKIGYLEPELRQMARHALLALTPGAVNQDIPALTYQRVQRPIFPLDQDFESPDLATQLFGVGR
jgi:microcystin degradation protein MlrC